MGVCLEKRKLEEERINKENIKISNEIEPLYKTKFKKMRKSICEIIGKTTGTGFFCKIKYKNKLIPVLITNYHVINDNYLKNKNTLKCYINGESKILNINKDSIIYSSITNQFDIIIIKLKNDEINHYLEIDDNIFNINSENSYKNEHICILHYKNSGNASISYGYGIEQINYYDVKHFCYTLSHSSGGPILSLLTNKIIGIHKLCVNKENDRYNIGTFLKFPLNDLNIKKNEIIIKIKVNLDDINKDIYFLDNIKNKEFQGIKYDYDNLKELNKDNTELYINGDKKEYKKYFRPKKEGIYTILLKFNILISDCSHMFECCSKIINIDLSNFDTTNVNNMKCMFSFCESLESLKDISKLDTIKVKNMSFLFFNCKSLKSLPHISKWDTKNVTNMRSMFSHCLSLLSLPKISKWDTNNVADMSNMFSCCKSLISLPNIFKWNTNNVIDMNNMFHNCESLKSLPYISKWNTINITDMNNMFSNCYSLELLPDISNWNTRNVIDMSDMFSYCYKLKSLPDISKWDTKNVTNMSGMFSHCSSLKLLPDIFTWNTTNVIDISWIFYYCKSLESLPYISKWDTKKFIKINGIFSCCESLKSLPDISNWNTKNVNDMNNMFSFCESLKSLPDISKWNTINVNDMNNIFFRCLLLESLPDISKWNTKNVKNMNNMFSYCRKLKSLPDISKWNIRNVIDMCGILAQCISLNSLPDISKWNKINYNEMRKTLCKYILCEFNQYISNLDTKNMKNMISKYIVLEALPIDILKIFYNNIKSSFYKFKNNRENIFCYKNIIFLCELYFLMIEKYKNEDNN